MMSPEEFTQEMSKVASHHRGDREAIDHHGLDLVGRLLRDLGYSAGIAIFEEAREKSH